MATELTNPAVRPAAARGIDTALAAIAVLRRYWWFVLIVTLVALVGTFILTKQQTRIYSASTTVVLRTSETDTLFPLRSTEPRQVILSSAIERLFTSTPEFVDLAREGAPAGVSVSIRAGSSDLVFTARGQDPQPVARAADHWAETYVVERHRDVIADFREEISFLEGQMAELEARRIEVRSELDAVEALIKDARDAAQLSRLLVRKLSLDASLQQELLPVDQQLASMRTQLADFDLLLRFLEFDDLRARIVQPATVPTDPVSPNLQRNLFVGGLLGLALGITLPYLRASLSDMVEEREDVTVTASLPVLGSIPSYAHDTDASIEVLDNADSAAAAQYQALLTAIEFAAIGEPTRSIFFTSAAPADGKTTTALNVAALAAQYQNVLLVDADLRRSSVHKVTGIANTTGLSDVLRGVTSFDNARASFERAGTSFDVLAAGPSVHDSALLFRGERWKDLLEELAVYDLVVIDGPPVLAVTDAALIGSAVDAQVLIVRWGKTERKTLAAARALLVSNRTRTLGVVVNRAIPSKAEKGYYGTYQTVPAEAD